ncbi:cytochrome c oxidase subunit II [Natrarchaeobius halalkaliphilus]|uniref:Cytochrome c oxidase subunit II n=1 Tax=Natrarchaeobius halalkaliphilus TaxID=1679091 RepID=A0A3N6LS77_9EURY|nr:cytochrome c oxidase subunit II [Natrarchaeobius halalkaliphilus]RQG91367.1 cytochrome c oxidase subunit II [Natrarchaeobius halalkaliphilus]
MQVQTRVDVFEDIFLVFLALGTLVGVVVVAYTLYNAYKYRDSGEPSDDDDLPTLGELPTGGKGGKKLFVSFGLSAIIVISLVVWTYGMLLYVEDGPDDNPTEDAIEVDVEAWAFDWGFEYENGVETTSFDEGMVIPADTPIWIEVTSTDVWHTFGISDLRVKADAIPGETEQTWFMADEPGDYLLECFELCGAGHSGMTSDVTVMAEDDFDQWLDDQLTLTIALEDDQEEPEPVTDGFELLIEHQENDEFEQDLSAALGPDDFEDGTVEITDFDQGGSYDVVITPTDGEFEEIEDTIDFTGPTDETYTLEDPDADDEDNDEDSDTTDDGSGGDDE